jgi:5-methylcytosine-specific restriction endonuclease McrA
MAGRHRSPSTRFSSSNKWKRLKRSLFSISNKCEYCGSTEKLTVHHIKPRSSNPELSFEPSNLVILCEKCHNHIHNG